jgi:hypothetical protein
LQPADRWPSPVTMKLLPRDASDLNHIEHHYMQLYLPHSMH